MPCRRSWVRVPSSASQNPLETAGFCALRSSSRRASDSQSQVVVRFPGGPPSAWPAPLGESTCRPSANAPLGHALLNCIAPRASSSRSTTERGRALGLQSRGGGNAEEPRLNVPLCEREGKRRMPVRREDVGASAGGQSWGLCQPDEGVRPLGDLALPCSPPRSRSLRLAREREAGVRGIGRGLTANADAPASALQSPPPRAPRLSAKGLDEVDLRREEVVA